MSVPVGAASLVCPSTTTEVICPSSVAGVGMLLQQRDVGQVGQTPPAPRRSPTVVSPAPEAIPWNEKRRLKSMPALAAAAEAVLTQVRPGWRNPKARQGLAVRAWSGSPSPGSASCPSQR